MEKRIFERKERLQSDLWNVEALFANWDDWNREFLKIPSANDCGLRWPELAKEEKHWKDPASLQMLLHRWMAVEMQLDALYTYAHLRHDEDISEEQGKKAYMDSLSMRYALQEETAWIQPTLLQLPSDTISQFMKDDTLTEYRVMLAKMLRMKSYILGEKEEHVLALSEKALDTSYRVFSSFQNVDLQFPPCVDTKGEKHELTLGTYQLYMKSADRTLRREAFVHLHSTFGQYANTLCDLLQGQIQKHVFSQRARGYPSCVFAALYPHQIDVSVYESLIRHVQSHLHFLHQYVSLRKQILGYDPLHVYDLGVPLLAEEDRVFSYDEAVHMIYESLTPLGAEYQAIVKKGLTEDRWVDRYENKRKRSGAYSGGCYGSKPYILMNYHGTLRDVCTLTHEAGHSMHSYFSCRHQRYQDHQYPIFLAEVASTFHEELLFRYLLRHAKTAKEKAYLISQKIDDLRNTLFRQALFAEFEKHIHEIVEKGHALTPGLLKGLYRDLMQKYFGSDLYLDVEVEYEWSRIPHFYYNFYVYQYATGISAAHTLAEKVVLGEKGSREDYLTFLSLGGSKDPLSALQIAGVDMASCMPVIATLRYFGDLVKQLQNIKHLDGKS